MKKKEIVTKFAHYINQIELQITMIHTNKHDGDNIITMLERYEKAMKKIEKIIWEQRNEAL